MTQVELTGREAFSKLIKSYMETGKASKTIAAKRGKGKIWRYPELGDQAGLDGSTIRKWVEEGKEPYGKSVDKIIKVFFDHDVIDGSIESPELDYFRRAIRFWSEPLDQIECIDTEYTEFDKNNQRNHPLEGRYIMLRPTFDAPTYFGLYDISFIYNDDAKRLEFRKTLLKDQPSTAFITKPKDSPHIEIVDIKDDGFNSLTICSVPDEDGYIYGAIFTMGPFSINAHLPSIAPVVFFPFDETAEMGLVSPNSARYVEYAELIARSRDPIVFKLHNMVSF